MKLIPSSDKPVIYFSIWFVILSIVFSLISPYFFNSYRSIFTSMGSSYFNGNINKDYTLKRLVTIKNKTENNREFEVQTIFYDRKHDNTFPMKYIGVDIVSEGFIPSALLIILILSSPVPIRRKIISGLIGILVINIYIIFKLYAISFDNFNSPEFAIKTLSFPISGLVYYYNYLLNVTGYSINFVIVIIIWLATTLRLSDIEKVANK